MLEEQGALGVEKVPLMITGISESGYLTAVDDGNANYELHPDGNRYLQEALFAPL